MTWSVDGVMLSIVTDVNEDPLVFIRGGNELSVLIPEGFMASNAPGNITKQRISRLFIQNNNNKKAAH